MPAPLESSLFRFVSLRQPKKLEEPRPGVAIVEYPLTPQQKEQPPEPLPERAVGRGRRSLAASVPDSLYDRFLTIRRANGPRTDYESAVTEFLASDQRFDDADALAPWTILYEKIQLTPGAASDPSLQTLIQESLGIPSLIEYVGSRESFAMRKRLFENLFATIVRPDDPPLREALLSALKVEQIIVEIVERSSTPTPDDNEPLSPIAMEFIVVLPKEIFPIPAADVAMPGPGGPHPDPTVSEDFVRGMQAAATAKTVLIGQADVGAEELCYPHLPDTCQVYEGGPIPTSPGRVHSLGIADLLVVRQTLQRYVPGEVSHITNVMATETRSTTHRHLQRVEETVSIDRETTTESERDLQSTERYSLSNEAKQVLEDSTKFDAGVTVTASGLVQVTANAAYATTSSQQTATTVASAFAKEITQRATEKVTERVREQRSRTTIEEIEETNLHSFVNTTDTHIVGIYQWVDVIYLARLYNFGRRLMLEFIVPEPAAFYVYASAALQSGGGGVDNPIAPTDPSPLGMLSSANDITAVNYAAWAARYGAVEVEAPPLELVTVAAAFGSMSPDTQYDLVTQKSLTVPDGYAAHTARVRLGHSTGVDGSTYARAFIGTKDCGTSTGNQFFTLTMDGETGIVPINLQSAKTYLLANIEILCQLTANARDAWKLKTYNAIIAAYEKRKAAHDLAVGSGVGPAAFSPSRNREIERLELKRGCLQLLTGQRFDAFSAMRVHQSLDYPEFLEGRAEMEGKYMEFFEQACDWKNVTYTFYPYFWTRKPNWIRMNGYETSDPIFTNFLQAGAARVVVPAHPAYTKAVLHFLSTGEIWNGDDVPVVGDPLYISIVDELMQGSGFGESSDPVAEWEVRLPTTLTLLKTVDPAVLPDWTPPGRDND